jgi:metallophosphoesterase superfamily enzyme
VPFAALCMSTATSQTQCPPRVEIRRDIWLDGRLAIWLEELRILVVSDLHWGYAASHRSEGNLLPAWGDAEIARRLNSLLVDYQPQEMIWLGDSLHTLAGSDSATDFLESASIPVTIVSGNLDARWIRARDRISVSRSPYFFHHGDQVVEVPPDSLEIIGHHHPAVSWQDGAGTRLKLPALVTSPRRLILPAFSPWAGGVPWNFGDARETIYAIGSKRIFTVPQPRDQKGP